MWIWVIIIACVIGAIIGFASSDDKGEGALQGALGGGCLAMGCLARIFFCSYSIAYDLLAFWAIILSIYVYQEGETGRGLLVTTNRKRL